MRINLTLEITRSRSERPRSERALDILAMLPSLATMWTSLFQRPSPPEPSPPEPAHVCSQCGVAYDERGFATHATTCPRRDPVRAESTPRA